MDENREFVVVERVIHSIDRKGEGEREDIRVCINSPINFQDMNTMSIAGWSPLGIAIVIGILSSFLTWSILNKLIIPRIMFSEFIAKSPRKGSLESGFGYYVRMKNKSFFRKIVDIQIFIRAYIPNFHNNKESMLTVFTLNCSQDRFPYIKRNRNKYSDWCHPFKTIRIEEPIKNKDSMLWKKLKNQTLEELFSVYPETKIKVVVIAHDSFTGSKSIIESTYFEKRHLKTGQFEKYSMKIG